MRLTPEDKELGRRNFLKALAGTPAVAVLGGAALVRGPLKGGPVRVGAIAIGSHGRGHMHRPDPAYCQIVAVADINPDSLRRVDEELAKRKRPPVKHYTDWHEMLQKEDIEAVLTAPPLSAHAEITVGCLEAGKHVFCEKMMAWDDAGCEQMVAAARKSGKVVEIGYQRYYNRIYQAAYEGIIKTGKLGELHTARIVWNRNKSWRREPGKAPEIDTKRWGYEDYDHLINWRLYKKHSQGLTAELGSHMVNVTNWFFGTKPDAVVASGGIYRFKDREVPDHVYANFEYPGGRTAVFMSTESDPFEGNYEAFFGTNGTLIFEGEKNAYFFDHTQEAKAAAATQIEVGPKSGPVLETTESRPPDAVGRQAAPETGNALATGDPYRAEVERWCAAIRTGRPVECGPERAMHSAKACIRANQSLEQGKRLEV